MLCRTHVARTAAGKGRAVLEGLWLDRPAIEACFNDHHNEEEAVQAGLAKWMDGIGRQPPTWAVLLCAMQYARIAPHHVQSLKEELGLPGMFTLVIMYEYTGVCVCSVLQDIPFK